jgi:predicted MFS family arabinose efflux permease
MSNTHSSATLITISFIFAYILSSFPIMLIGLFITDIAQAFSIDVGAVGFVRSVAEVSAVVMGVLLGALSVRYRQRSLLLVAMVIMCVGAVVLGTATIFPLFVLTFACLGASRLVIRSMSQSLVGTLFTLEERPTITGYLMIGEGGGYLVGSALAILLPSFQALALIFLLPVSTLALILVVKQIPVTPLVQQNPLSAFRDVVRNRSATSVFASHILVNAGVNHCLLTFFMPLYLQRFQADRSLVTMMLSAIMIAITVLSFFIGRIINRFGRKPVVVSSALTMIFLSAVMMLSLNFTMSMLTWILALILLGLYIASSNSYALEQVPNYRGTMMSLQLTAQFIGMAIGSAVGGMMLMTYGFDGLGWFSLLGVLGVVLYQIGTQDPTR